MNTKVFSREKLLDVLMKFSASLPNDEDRYAALEVIQFFAEYLHNSLSGNEDFTNGDYSEYQLMAVDLDSFLNNLDVVIAENTIE